MIEETPSPGRWCAFGVALPCGSTCRLPFHSTALVGGNADANTEPAGALGLTAAPSAGASTAGPSRAPASVKARESPRLVRDCTAREGYRGSARATACRCVSAGKRVFPPLPQRVAGEAPNVTVAGSIPATSTRGSKIARQRNPWSEAVSFARGFRRCVGKPATRVGRTGRAPGAHSRGGTSTGCSVNEVARCPVLLLVARRATAIGARFRRTRSATAQGGEGSWQSSTS